MELDPLSFTFLDFGTTDKATNILFIHGIKRYMYMYMYVYIINIIYIYYKIISIYICSIRLKIRDYTCISWVCMYVYIYI